MLSEEQKGEILKIVNDNFYDRKLCCIFWLVISFFIMLVVFYIAYVSKHNSDVDYRNKQLEFCDGIYKSDNVILEQCKDYFVILESGDN